MYPTPHNISGVLGIIQYADAVTSGYLLVGTLFSILLISFLSFKSLYIRNSDALMYASFIDLFLSSLLWISGLLASKWLILLVVIFLASAIWSYLDE